MMCECRNLLGRGNENKYRIILAVEKWTEHRNVIQPHKAENIAVEILSPISSHFTTNKICNLSHN